MAVLDIPAPMSGTLRELMVVAGDRVTERQEIALLESMKMEIPIESPATGTVVEVFVSAPQRITEGDRLMRLELG